MSKDWKLFLDDERYPDPSGWIIARNYHDAVWYVQNYGIPSHISFDHDLGSPQNMTGMDFAKWFCNYVMDHDIPNPGFTYHVHSMNPVGAKNIDCYMNQFIQCYWWSKIT